MAESQQARNREPSGTAPTRQLWTEERRETFLEVADRVGWSNHTLIASHLGMTIRQVRNFKTKFPRSRWQGPTTTQTDTTEPTNSSGRTSPTEQRDLIQRDLEEADPPGDAETNPLGDVETDPPEDAETGPPEQTDTPGQSDPAEQEDLPGVDTPGQSDLAEQEDLPGVSLGQSDSAEQEDLSEVDPPTEADPPGATIRPDPSEEAGPSTGVETSVEVDSPEEANPLEAAIEEVLQAAVDAAILAARPSENRRGVGENVVGENVVGENVVGEAVGEDVVGAHWKPGKKDRGP